MTDTGPGGTAGDVPQPVPASASGLLDLLGGRRGMLDSAVPGAIFVALYIVVRKIGTPLWIAGGTAVLIFAFRVARREPLRHAASGLVGVAVAAGLAVITGKPENYFLPALVLNAAYAVGSAISLAVRWPVLGLIIGPLLGEGTGWRADRARLRAYSAATALWTGMFVLRVAALFPLWLAGLLVPLGIGRIVLGYPLYALVVWLTWLILRRPVSEHRSEARDGTSAPSTPS
jgi:hypothetical protein